MGNGVDEIRKAGDGDRLTGTSYAAPFISGIVACLLGIDRDLSPDEIRTILSSSGLRLADKMIRRYDPKVGFGLFISRHRR
jgi:subtilisin family serine protease